MQKDCRLPGDNNHAEVIIAAIAKHVSQEERKKARGYQFELHNLIYTNNNLVFYLLIIQ